MTILVTLLARFWPQIAVGAALLAGWGYADQLWCNAPCQRARAAGQQCEARAAKAQQLATDMALLAAKRLSDIDAAVKRQKDLNHAELVSLQERAAALAPRASVHLSAAALRVWSDSARAANDPAAAAVDHRAPDPVPATTAGQQDGGGSGDTWYSERELGTFVVDAALAYRDAITKWGACVSAYEALRNPEEQAQ